MEMILFVDDETPWSNLVGTGKYGRHHYMLREQYNKQRDGRWVSFSWFGSCSHSIVNFKVTWTWMAFYQQALT
jgi:hypothetical protein